MPTWMRTRWLACWLLGALAFAGCATDTTTGASGVSIELEIADGIEIDEVNYAVSLRDEELHSGTINTGSSGSTASIEIYGLAEDQGYVFSMSATSTDGETNCSGSAIFNVFVGQVTPVAVVLRCKPPTEFGSVRVNGKINYCADIRWADVSPLQTSIGNQIDVNVVARDEEGDTIEYRWTATSGSFANPSVPRTTYTCEELGVHTITITVSDDGFEYCDCFWDVDVTCVDGDGGTGGTGGCVPDGGAQHAGPPNRACGDSTCGALEVCVEGVCQDGALVFASSRQSDAALGGPRGADMICADLARAAGLGGYWMSWTSNSCTSPQTRFERPSITYRRMDGTPIATSWPDLTDGSIENPIDIDEMGNVIVGTDPFRRDTLVWTNTDFDGTVHINNGCWGLTSNASSGVFGVHSAAGSTASVFTTWSLWSTPGCATDNLRLYCFEQSADNQ